MNRNAVALVCLLLLVVSCISKPKQKAESPNVEIGSDLGRPTLSQQKMCAEQAKKAFDEDQQRERQAFGNASPLSDYTSHFDPQRNICYIRVNTTTADKRTSTVASVVYDAFEGRVFASYVWVNAQGKKYWEVKPTSCEVHPPNQPKIDCASSEEFDGLVEKWFSVAK